MFFSYEDDEELNIDFSKKFSVNPENSDIEALAKCFNYKANLPQVVIDKIVDSYDEKTNSFKNFNITVGDFTTRYQPVVGSKEINESIAQMTKKSL